MTLSKDTYFSAVVFDQWVSVNLYFQRGDNSEARDMDFASLKLSITS